MNAAQNNETAENPLGHPGGNVSAFVTPLRYRRTWHRTNRQRLKKNPRYEADRKAKWRAANPTKQAALAEKQRAQIQSKRLLQKETA